MNALPHPCLCCHCLRVQLVHVSSNNSRSASCLSGMWRVATRFHNQLYHYDNYANDQAGGNIGYEVVMLGESLSFSDEIGGGFSVSKRLQTEIHPRRMITVSSITGLIEILPLYLSCNRAFFGSCLNSSCSSTPAVCRAPESAPLILLQFQSISLAPRGTWYSIAPSLPGTISDSMSPSRQTSDRTTGSGCVVAR
jgi:hypothetical protein